MFYDVDLREEFFGYDPLDYEKWGTDRSFVQSALERTGTLGCDISRYLEQSTKAKGYQHFPEVEAARRLVEADGISRDAILYENYYLSAAALRAAAPNGKKVAGTRLLQRALAPRFFEAFDELYDKNLPLQKVSASSLQVDLFVLDKARRTVAFWEVKKISPHKSAHEGLAEHQKACLAIFSYLFEKRREEVFLDSSWRGSVRLAIYVPHQALRTHRFEPGRHQARINV